ncbi:MAG: DNA polymerase III subunit alpha, partial [Alphaproteobacteria bacterium]|nr:DNA polymerase III subunit alpha [Alphaproteobacteria bacterium]
PRQLNRMQLENLIRAGAFDALEPNRARLFAGAETVLRRAQAEAEEAASGQIGLFGGVGHEALRLPDTPDWPPLEKLGFEAEAVGFHLTAHPLDTYAASLRRLGVARSNELEALALKGVSRVKLAGSVIGAKERITRTGSRMAWVRISDSVGSCEVTFFAELLQRGRELLSPGSNVLVTAELRREDEALRITAQHIVALSEAVGEIGAGLKVWLEQTEAVEPMSALLRREGRGKGRIILIPRLDPDQRVEIALPGGFNVSPRLAEALQIVPGVERVETL